MKQIALISMGFLFFATSTIAEELASPQRMENVEHRREELVPYAADKTLETFSKTVHGGVMHVIAKTADDSKQVQLIQNYLRQIADAFGKGDFSSSEKMHGANMPGLQQLKTAKTDDIRFEYKGLPNGAQIHFSTEYPQYVQALHEWLDAQIKDHGNAPTPGHMKHHSGMAE
ncbi:aspartate carbamoyltransferase [Methylomicrobium sp. Wu6]|uniref:aspartate carbamoyltransferase n=1 Tax=Methylomicrobium sp. Wu6 TaxID=3107928 RepID=UPI002DD693FE|nr:aspartate carbamoyltransferase [Methylomicrobium sp. Wu6]MEC4748093.1 aspartate carbamoyltransferase [Methylomicrobium sp. Wu6]